MRIKREIDREREREGERQRERERERATGRERERQREMVKERWFPQQKRVKWMSVAEERERESE